MKQWLLTGVAIVAVLGVAVAVNLSYDRSGSDIVAGTIDTDNGDLKINWSKYATNDISLNGESDVVTITKSGIYHLTGTLDGAIIVNANNAEVKLILDNVTIKNSSGPAIACYAADDLVIELVGESTLEDGASYASTYDEDVTGVIYSKSDLTFQGDGTMNLTANYQDGIVGKDDLKFNSGTYDITANDDGIRGKDSVYIVDGNFTITAKADAIKSTNDVDVGKGFVLIEKGTFTLASKAKGIKSASSTLIYDGTFNIISTDDAIHSNNYVGIVGGDITISSSDDGIHADRELIVDGGTINIAKRYEGLEAQAVTINAGDISIVASDDGINAGGGADSSANNRPGAGAFDSDTNCIIAINGGNLYVNASGDGIDSNGYVYFNGGTVVVDGPTNNGNGALDAGVSIAQTGGTVLAIGASGMAETLGSASSVYNASIYLSATQSAGTKLEIKDSTGATIISHTSAKAFNHIAVGTTDFQYGETYTLYIDGTKYTEFTISSITTTVGNSNQNFNNMMLR